MTLLDLPTTIDDSLDFDATASSSPPTRAPAGAIALCREITRRRARNFHMGLQLAPEPKRSALIALYTWMRHADDLADGDAPASGAGSPDAPGAEARLAGLRRLRALTDRTLAGDPSLEGAPAWWAAFAWCVEQFAIPRSIFSCTLDALERDATGPEVRTTQDLAWYTDRVAGTVALGCVSIWGVRHRHDVTSVGRLAIFRARAVQLTNILRDLREDLSCEPARSYLPAESLRAEGLAAADLRSWARPEACEAFVLGWIEQARGLYEASAGLDLLIDPRCARVSWALAAVYLALLETIARDPSRVAARRVSVPRRRKASIALAGWLGVGLPG